MIGQRLKELRKKKDISQDELSKILGITTSAVGQYETDVRNPSYEILINLSKYFCVSTDWILGLTNDETININVPKDYALFLSQVLTEDISPEKLKMLIEFAKSWQDE